ncbi:MAG: chemotaxis protein CheW [Limnothrix sp. RL_2_0]|nr:chemotaxis protein CheW [Limnothrix sp. RL_2_0]
MATITATTDYFQVELYSLAIAPDLAQTRLLIPLGDIAEIITVERREICPLPGVPKGVTGVLNLRGQLIWVMDLRMVQGQVDRRGRPNPQEKITIVLLQSANGQIGCLVTTLMGITACDLTELTVVDLPLQKKYPFCMGQLALAHGNRGMLLDTALLLSHLQSI